MVNETVLTVSIKLQSPGHPIGPRRLLVNAPFGGSFAHGAPRRDLSPQVGKLANLGPDGATGANVGRTWPFLGLGCGRRGCPGDSSVGIRFAGPPMHAMPKCLRVRVGHSLDG
jgi:hypothetical protein